VPVSVILLLDNRDSFTWNVVQGLEALGASVRVVRSDATTVDEALAAAPEALVLGPGPGRPRDAGITLGLLQRAPEALPVLGVCLGHQALVESLGGAIVRDQGPVHGRASLVEHDGDALFDGVPSPFEAGRYHSLVARSSRGRSSRRATAWTLDGRVMAVRHRAWPRFGVQFHPDSILTPVGPRVFANFLALARAHAATWQPLRSRG